MARLLRTCGRTCGQRFRVGVVVSSYPRFEGDHAGAFVRRALQRHAHSGIEFTVVTPCSDLERARPRDSGIEIVEANVPGGIFYGAGAPENVTRQGLSAWPAAAAAVASLTVTARRALADVDAMLGHWLAPGGLVCAAIAGGRPWGLVCHSTAARVALAAPWPAKALLRRSLRSARFVTASEPTLAEQLRRWLARDVTWCGPAVDTVAFSKLPLSDVRTTGRVRIGFVGRRVSIKGLDRAVAAVARAVSRGSQLELHVAGPGHSAAVDRCGAHWLRDHGVLSGSAALARFYAGIDVLLVPSRAARARAEGLPCVALEAGLAGRAVLSTDSGGLAHVVPRDWRVPADVSTEVLSQRLAALDTPDGRAAIAREGRRQRRRMSARVARWQRLEQVQIEQLCDAAPG